jgi:hypothetical protein
MKKIYMKMKVGLGGDSREAFAFEAFDLEIAIDQAPDARSSVEILDETEAGEGFEHPVEVLTDKPFASSGQ